ncbi:hypothetical protein AJ80_06529 [Polytolypa hystricis UAMH7299]|uniref:FCP1 homology domain-containing protein n=1 Tax=Polytolypa hystricis (strain UAMH7299) TaxID=1447883 RepID=A0A2B7XMC6_POLH7|nr:hypothetical protein AJ80_06529 [Polytolypa hystricis UAMH7299]
MTTPSGVSAPSGSLSVPPNDAPTDKSPARNHSIEDESLERKTSKSVSAQGSSASTDRPKKKRSFLRVTARSSSNANQQDSSTAMRDDSQDDAGGASRFAASLTKKSRDASRASSRRSRRTQPTEVVSTVAQKAAMDVEESSKAGRRPKSSSSKLFSFLSCCSSSTADSEDTAVPPKKSTRPRSSQGRQSIPVEKSEPTVADSSTAGSKEPSPIDEKATIKQSERRPSQVDSEPQRAAVNLEVTANKHLDEQSTLAPTATASNSTRAQESETSRDLSGDAVPGPSSAPDVGASASAEKASEALPEQPNGTNDDAAQDLQAEDPHHEDAVTAPRDEATQRTSELPPPPPLDQAVGQPIPPVPAVPEKQQWLLPPLQPHLQDRKCLVLDLDETLVHSSFKVLEKADFTIPVEIEGQYHNIYVIKRPGVDQFMKRVGELYEVVLFTASVSKYGDPLLDQLDIHKVIHHRLFRDSCYNHQGNYVKDLSQVGRDLRETIIIDNSPTSYIFHPQHAIPISSWFSDAHDNELLDLIPVLEDLAGSQVRDVSLVLDVTL